MLTIYRQSFKKVAYLFKQGLLSFFFSIRLFEKQELEKVEQPRLPHHKPGRLNRQSFTQLFTDSRYNHKKCLAAV